MKLRDRSNINKPQRFIEEIGSLDKKIPYKKKPRGVNLFVSRLQDIPVDINRDFTSRELCLLAVVNRLYYQNQTPKFQYIKYLLIFLNILVIIWCYYHLLYSC